MSLSTASSTFRVPFRHNWWIKLFIFIFLVVWADSLVGTSDFTNWLIENALVFLSLIFLVWAYKKYAFSDLSWLFIFVFLCLHVYGSKHTYAENPFGFWLQDVFGWERNHYDRIIHFAFGFLLTYPMREAFLKWWKFPSWVSWVLPIEIALSIGSLYELIEWAVADIFFPEQGAAYLGTQGDEWDAQKDIVLGVAGAALAVVLIAVIKIFGRTRG